MNERFIRILNFVALGIIVAIIGVLFYSVILFMTSSKNKPSPSLITFTLHEVPIQKNDSSLVIADGKFVDQLNKTTDSLKNQIEEIKRIKADIEESQNRNSDYFKIVLALIGSVFAIVGFFGFKSIHETRENAINAARIQAEREANHTAKEIARIEISKINIELREQIETLIEQGKDFQKRIDELEDNKSKRIVDEEETDKVDTDLE